MVSLDPELSKLSILLMSTSATFGSQNGSTFSNFLKRKLETSLLQHESKIEDILRFFPDKTRNNEEHLVFLCAPEKERERTSLYGRSNALENSFTQKNLKEVARRHRVYRVAMNVVAPVLRNRDVFELKKAERLATKVVHQSGDN